jgi:hypothetical protein
MIIYGRDARTGPRSLKHLFSGQYRNPEANRLSGVYELSMRRASEAGSPGRIVLVVVCVLCQLPLPPPQMNAKFFKKELMEVRVF